MVEVEELSTVEIELPISTAMCVKIGAGCMTCFFADQCLQNRNDNQTAEASLIAEEPQDIITSSRDDLYDITNIPISSDTLRAQEDVKEPEQLQQTCDTEAAPEVTYDYTKELEDDSIPLVVAYRTQPSTRTTPVVVNIRAESSETAIRDDAPTDVLVDNEESTIVPEDRPVVEQEAQDITDTLDISAVDTLITIDDTPEQHHNTQDFTQQASMTIESVQYTNTVTYATEAPVPIIQSYDKPTEQKPLESHTQTDPVIEPGYIHEQPILENVEIVMQVSYDTEYPATTIDLPTPTDSEEIFNDENVLTGSESDESDILRRYPVTEDATYKSSILEIRPILSGVDELVDPEKCNTRSVPYKISYAMLMKYIATLALSTYRTA